ncbi:capsule assembly Wzi family protein [Dyadobacter psychrotolerans]|uniref:Capsule assembly Wzi family protein n=1 Tax=Dyadobacter psychrotolerans TaxID=2541721 RepID=A0A4R5D7C9_9BACT|nr:capsule assembly Wzi family protein [Dyadobacter psychrotolerans]TDE08547.1 hypothetical protein E0F88_32485 [Dyadobacter psychrotolerans]
MHPPHCKETNIKTLFRLFLLLIPLTSFSQSSEFIKDSTTNYIEIIGFGGTSSRTPFWLQANQYGIVPKNSPSGSVRAQLEKVWTLDQKNIWRVGGGVEAAGNYTEQKSNVLFPQIYGTIRFKNWELFAGRKKQFVSIADSTIGMGSYAWSGNALPIPKISIGTRGFVSLPFTKGWVSFNGFYSDGMFENSRPVTSDLKFHQKMLYLRLGKATSRVKLYGGFNHQVQWGGKSSFNTVDDQMPKGLSNYINAVIGKAHSNNPSIHDSTGRVGNHLGSVDIGLEFETYGSTILIYRQNLYEDGSLIWLSNIRDGLNGVSIHRKNSYGANFEITRFVLEFLYTKSQGGEVADWSLPTRHRGKDDYFNNGQVRDGWAYYDRTIGTPFIPPSSDTKWKWPQYANFMTSNNRVSVLHLGLNGTLFQKITWTSKLSYSSNSGTYNAPFEDNPTQFSGLVTFQSRLNVLGGISLKGSFAADIGDLYPKNYGFSLGLRKDFNL